MKHQYITRFVWVSVHDMKKINDSSSQLSEDVVKFRWKSAISTKSCIWRWLVRNMFRWVYVWPSWIKCLCERNEIVNVKLCVQIKLARAEISDGLHKVGGVRVCFSRKLQARPLGIIYILHATVKWFKITQQLQSIYNNFIQKTPYI